MDAFDHIPDTAYQHVGENIYSLVKGLANAEELLDETTDSEKMTFYDFFGWTMYTYSETWTIVQNSIAIVCSCLVTLFSFLSYGVLSKYIHYNY